MSTLVLVVVTLAVAGAITYILMRKGTIADANNRRKLFSKNNIW